MGVILFVVGCIQGYRAKRIYGIPLAITYFIFVLLAALIYFVGAVIPNYETVKMIAAPWIDENQPINKLLFDGFLFYLLGLLIYSIGYGIFYGCIGKRKSQ